MLIANELFAANEVGSFESGNESIKKYGKLLKTKKLSKSQKSAKSRKELLKSGNLPNFNAKENRPSFLTPDARTTFNYLRLAFTKALILQYFNLKCHIWIETDTLNYVIDGVLSQLVSKTRPDGVVIKTDLSQ